MNRQVKPLIDHTKITPPPTYKKVVGKSGRTWVYQDKTQSAADFIHISADPVENKLGYKGLRGYGGRELSFPLEDGSTETLVGPWHANAEALFEDTGIDLREKHLTMCIIGQSWSWVENVSYIQDVLFEDLLPTEGDYFRGTKIAMDLARGLGKSVVCYSESVGGSSFGLVYPDQIDVHGNRSKAKEGRTKS